MKEFKDEMQMNDIIEKIGNGSLIQHGKLSDRIYLMKLDELDADSILNKLSTIAEKNNYSKIFCKIQGNFAPLFFADGYQLEAIIPQFYKGKKDAFFVSKFLKIERFLEIKQNTFSDLSTLFSSEINSKKNEIGTKYSVRELTKKDVNRITEIYKIVFETYPFPIHNPDYILTTMEENIQYFGVEIEGKLVALSSSEIDFKGENAEMTDFATHPKYTGHNLSTLLLEKMEEEMKNQQIKTVYTIARLNSIPMNKTFLRNGYCYSGTLKNNTNIAGKIESMNVYYKHIK